MSKQDVIAFLRRELGTVVAARRTAKGDPAANSARIALRRFQSQRMAVTHSDLLNTPDTAPAARFFLNDLYGAEDLTHRDSNLERVIPTMERLLPVSALETIAEAVALDALSERLDAAMAMRLGADFTQSEYVAAYGEVTSRQDRERQLRHVESVGTALVELIRIPLIGSTLAMMRGPAKLAKLSELQNFLERGFKAFKEMRNPADFVSIVVLRERTIMERLYAGAERPFELNF